MNYAKLLLFGEYTVLNGGDCIELPYKRYSGVLTLEEPAEGEEQMARWSNRQLLEFYHHLLKTVNTKAYSLSFDIEQMATDMSRGLWFKSDIPGQSGFGSSGALVATIVNRYGINVLAESTENLQRLFAALENNFHGNSSGMDPLVSFLCVPVAKIKNELHFANLQQQLTDEIKLFLVQAKQENNTRALIQTFKKRMADPGFKKSYSENLVPLTNRMISLILNRDNTDWFKYLKELSQQQKAFYSDIIPENLQGMMDSDLFHLKLLGSGGGYMLGFTRDYKETVNFFNTANIPLIRIRHSDLIVE
ncbi:hypothetical protein ACE1ET_11145 [Saccharicrinis sp. FJH62]|uniref:GHMP family kinase ATP-binding protein n=1 Tax=Saccharicrinis sp. FJH62 TaxID=3344657 RepID=UPI0035D4C203